MDKLQVLVGGCMRLRIRRPAATNLYEFDTTQTVFDTRQAFTQDASEPCCTPTNQGTMIGGTRYPANADQAGCARQPRRPISPPSPSF